MVVCFNQQPDICILTNKVKKDMALENCHLSLHDEQGGMNYTYDLYTEYGRLILQIPRSLGINTLDYVKALYETAGFFAYQLDLKLRSYREKEKLYKQLDMLEINVPKLIFASDQYIVTEYVNGLG